MAPRLHRVARRARQAVAGDPTSPLGLLVGLAAVAVAVAASCRTLPPRAPKPAQAAPPPPPPPQIASLVAAPVVRVGIVTGRRRVSIGADSGVVAWTGEAPGAWTRPREAARATFLPRAAASPARYRVQVASLASQQAALGLAQRIRAAVPVGVTVTWSDASRTYRVRAGEAGTREDAVGLAARLAAAGFPEARAMEAPAAPGRIAMLESGREAGGALILPKAPGEILYLDALPYRGLLEVRAGEDGLLTVVDHVNLEDYLRGVVPSELSPEAFPNLEALEAQAVAARTYAIRNLGGFESRGYDLCATAACQVYRGKSTEHPLTDQAVAETRGVIAEYQGRPIKAYYTSTCGGHTEDAENIFPGDGAPYLRGVACVPERSAWASIATTASPRALGPEEGLNRDVSLLVALGVLPPKRATARALAGAATREEVRRWTASLVRALRRRGCASRVDPPLNRRGSFFDHLVASLCWAERARRLVLPEDQDYLLGVRDRAELARGSERSAAALLVQEGILRPRADGTLAPNRVLSRADAAGILARAALVAGPPELLAGDFRGVVDGQLQVRRNDAVETYPLASGVALFRALDDRASAASEVTLAAGDRVRFVLRSGRIGFLEAEQTRRGAASDRGSRYYHWEVRATPADLARTLARYGRVGRVRDLEPLRLGVSGRVVELKVLGTEADLLLRGLEVRRGLGLRENLFVIDRERGAGGGVARFVFTGKGWGHGVGLCQVGAYGMAEAGASYQEILAHYYPGITLVNAAGVLTPPGRVP